MAVAKNTSLVEILKTKLANESAAQKNLSSKELDTLKIKYEETEVYAFNSSLSQKSFREGMETFDECTRRGEI